MTRGAWQISVVDSLKVKGKPQGSMPSAARLVEVGVPLEVARRWAAVRRDMTVGLKRRVRRDVN